MTIVDQHPPDAPAALTETHVSVVFLVGAFAYKLKKPVRFAFADLRTREARERLCHREVALNRRLAPDVYLGVDDVMGVDGRFCDHLVVMRRMPADRRLSTLVAAGDGRVPAAVEELGRVVARFHRDADRSPEIDDAGTAARVGELWHGNFDELAPFVGTTLDPIRVARAQRGADAYLAGRGPLLAERIRAGHVCDGHGDLQTDDVFCLDDGPRVLDCIEFDDGLRFGDVAADVAFAVMDLERLGASGPARLLIGAYEVEAGEALPPTLLRFYVAYRAQVRAKVACLRAAQLPTGNPDHDRACADARDRLDQCVRALDDAQPRLVLVGGLPGTGKSTLAAALGAGLGFDLVRSDVVRKEFAGLAPTAPASAPFGAGLYRTEVTNAVYRELLDRADDALTHGRSVVIDASFTATAHRRLAQEVAARTHSRLVALCCTVPAEIAAARIRARQAYRPDASDADPVIAAAMAAVTDPWPDAVELSTDGPAALVLAHATEAVTSPGPDHERSLNLNRPRVVAGVDGSGPSRRTLT